MKIAVRKLLYCLIVLILFYGKLSAFSGVIEDSVIFGINAGKTDIHGYYKDQLSSGYNVGFFVDYPFVLKRILYLESDFSYTKLFLDNTSLSNLTNYSLGFGPVIHILIGTRFKPYIGLSGTANYLELTAAETHKNERTFKIGAAAKAGFTVQQYKNFSINLGVKYSINELSDKAYQNVTYFAGATYSYYFINKEKAENNIRQLEIDDYYESGVKLFKIGDGLKAKDYFNKVISYDSNYKDVENYLAIISTSERNYKNAEKLISGKKYFEALPLLIDTEKYLISAFEMLRELRMLLAKEENELVKRGIDAYNKGDYEGCIYFLKREEMINPANESVNLYLPRAIKRYNALKKLE